MNAQIFIDDHLNPLLSKFDQEKMECFVLADFKLDLLKYKNNNQIAAFLTSCSQQEFVTIPNLL